MQPSCCPQCMGLSVEGTALWHKNHEHREGDTSQVPGCGTSLKGCRWDRHGCPAHFADNV